MYGVILRANIVKLLNDPPENRSNRVEKSGLACKHLGQELSVDIRNRNIGSDSENNSISKVNIILLLISGTFQA